MAGVRDGQGGFNRRDTDNPRPSCPCK